MPLESSHYSVAGISILPLMISESKIDETFPSRQFYIESFTPPYRLYQNCHVGGILAYVREDIPFKLIEMNSSIESISVELNLRKRKWLVNCSCNANNGNICDHLRSLGKSLNILLTQIMMKCFLWGTLMQKKLTFILRNSVIYIS